MYDAQSVLNHIDEHTLAVVLLGGGALVLNYVWFYEALRVSRRDGVYSIPAFCAFFWLVGDSSFVLNYDRWFSDYQHWYVELFCIGLVFTVMFEIAFTVQVARYGREELLPSATPAQFALLVLAGVVAFAVAWTMIRHTIGDGLWITYFSLATAAGPISVAALMVRRRSAAGQTTLLWGAYTAMAACWFTAALTCFGPDVRSAEHIALAIVTVTASAAVTYAVSRLRRAEETSSASPRSRRGQLFARDGVEDRRQAPLERVGGPLVQNRTGGMGE